MRSLYYCGAIVSWVLGSQWLLIHFVSPDWSILYRFLSFSQIWSCLFTTKLCWAQLFKWGHSITLMPLSLGYRVVNDCSSILCPRIGVFYTDFCRCDQWSPAYLIPEYDLHIMHRTGMVEGLKIWRVELKLVNLESKLWCPRLSQKTNETRYPEQLQYSG